MKTVEGYAELRARTHFSFLRGASSPDEMVERAIELGLTGIGITDRDGVYGIPKAFRVCKQHSESGLDSQFKLITGAELTLELPSETPSAAVPRTQLTLLAQDRAGYGLMCRMLTASHAGKEKGNAALSWKEFLGFALEPANRGLFALPESGMGEGPEVDYDTLRQLFSGRMAFPLERVLDGLDAPRTKRALELSKKYDAPIVATNQPYFHRPERRVLHDVLVSIREGIPLDRIGRKILPNAERFLKTPREMQLLFRDQAAALRLTLEIAERSTFSPGELKYRYPSEWIPAGATAQSYLTDLTWKGAQWRYPQGIPEKVILQLKHELKLVHELGFADYFLTIWEIVEFAKHKDILCQGRGSAANSAVCYCLGIVAIDPVHMDLLFERFISAERGEPPDIDVDFEHERREEVIQHIYERYGRDRAAMVSAVITYRSKSALREIAKALGVPHERAADDARVAALSEEIQGFPRHLSIHSGGFTLSADPIIETVPVEPARMEGRTIVQWDKEDLAIIGLLKVDVLALGMLSAMKKTFDALRVRTYAERVDLTVATTPQDDVPTYQMIQNADTIGVFQIESRAQMSMLGRLLPECFYDLVVEVAIVRPGPIVGQMVHPYLKRRRGLEDSRSPDPRLEPILGRTLGVPLFQEQVMKMAITMAGFTAGEADELRRAINAWRSKGSLEKLGRKLMNGLLASGLPKEFVDRIFLQIQGFSEYGFPESHAASFALLAYVSSYLKMHYPGEFTCALVNSQPMGFYSTHTLLEDVKRHGVAVLPIDPNHSEWDCVMEGAKSIRAGWRVVNGIVKADAERLVAERRTRPFASVADFLSRTRLRPAVLHRLAMGGAFGCFALDQRTSLWQVLGYAAVARANAPARVRGRASAPVTALPGAVAASPAEGTGLIRVAEAAPELRQLSLFTGAALDDSEKKVQRAQFEPLTPYQAIRADYESFGFSVRGHPMSALRSLTIAKNRIPPTTTETLRRAADGQVARLAGLVIVRQRPPTAKGTAFATLEDETGFLDLLLQRNVYEKYAEVFSEAPFLRVTGRVQRDRKAINLIVTHLEALEVDELLESECRASEELRVGSRDFK